MALPAIAKKILEAPRFAEEAAQLLCVLAPIEMALDSLMSLRTKFAEAMAAVDGLERATNKSTLNSMILGRVKELATELNERRAELVNAEYPFAGAAKVKSVGIYLLPKQLHTDDPASVFSAASEFPGAIASLHFRLLSRLCGFAARVEKAFGLESPPMKSRDVEVETQVAPAGRA